MIKELVPLEELAGKKARPVITGKHNGAKKTIRDLLDTVSYHAEIVQQQIDRLNGEV